MVARNFFFFEFLIFRSVVSHYINTFLGINPGDLYDTNTAVFTCSSGSETDTIAMFDESKSGFAILGHNKAMQANRLSYALNLNGE